MSLGRPLSLLEATALGIVLKRGPCAASVVLEEFAGSRSATYRGGAGSVYPIVHRLVGHGLLRREGRLVSTTDEGREALAQWVREIGQGAVSVGTDELRSRVYFMRVVSHEEAVEFVRSALEQLAGLLDRARSDREGYARSGDRFSELAMIGAVKETEARIEWLRLIQEALDSGSV